MKKTKVILASLGLISLFLMIFFARAATPQAWFDTSNELVWKYTIETLDESLAVTNTNVSYFKHNFTEITPDADSLKVRGRYWTATEEDFLLFGYDNASIWDDWGLSINVDILDSDLLTKFVCFFNELNANITDINSLSSNNETLVLFQMSFLLDYTYAEVVFTYILAQNHGSTFGHNLNSTTIIRNYTRHIVYDTFIDFSIDDSGHWINKTCYGNINLTYGSTSNVLLRSEILINLTSTEWNGMEYETELTLQRTKFDIIAPEVLLNDFPVIPSDPPPKPFVPGFSTPLIAGIIILSIASIVLAYNPDKRKKI